MKVSIEILIDVNHPDEAADSISEAMRPMLREFGADTNLIDWRYAPNGEAEEHDGSGFEYAA